MSTRIALAAEMIMPIPLRPWGRAKELADIHDVSRRFLYELRKTALNGLLETLAPHAPGPKLQEKVLVIDKDFLRRAITVFPMLKGTIRDIQLVPLQGDFDMPDQSSMRQNRLSNSV